MSSSSRTEVSFLDVSSESLTISQQLAELDKFGVEAPNGDRVSDWKVALQAWRCELDLCLHQTHLRGRLATQLANQTPGHPEPNAQSSSASCGNQASSISKAQDIEVDPGQRTGMGAVDTSTIERDCVACGESFARQDIGELLCGHLYCTECLKKMVTTALDDYRPLPLCCCRQPVEVSLLQAFIPYDLLESYQDRLVEQTTKSTYCHERTCSKLLLPETMEGNIARCPRCQACTCIICKGPEHEGDCPLDEEEQKMLQGLEDAWQRCFVCWRVIIKDFGCNHMT